MSGCFTIVARIDVNENGDWQEWVPAIEQALRDCETSTYRQVERFSVTVERPEVVWPT